MEAINFAREAKIDIVLVDTAGRMQDNEPLMRALAKVCHSSNFYESFLCPNSLLKFTDSNEK